MFHSWHINTIFGSSWATWNDKYLSILLIYLPFYWFMWTRFFDTAFEDGHWHLQLQISPHLPLTIILGREVTFGGLLSIIIAPPTAVTLMIGMLSDASRRGANRQWQWLHRQYTRLPRHPHGAIDVYDRLLLCGGVVSLSVFIYEVGSDDVKCADFTYVVFTSLYNQNYRDSAAADVKNGFSTKF